MKYLIRYYYENDKTRFYETTVSVDLGSYLWPELESLELSDKSIIILKITKL